MDKKLEWISISWYFVLIGVINGTWVSRLPNIKEMDHLSNSMVGFVLLFAAIGGLISFPLVSKLNHMLGCGKALLCGSIWLCLTTPVIGIQNLRLRYLSPAMCSIGCALALVDISMTTQASLFEKKYRTSFMGYCMSMISIGNFSGAMFGGLFAYYDVSPHQHFCIISYGALFFSIVFYLFLFSKDDEDVIYDRMRFLTTVHKDNYIDEANENDIEDNNSIRNEDKEKEHSFSHQKAYLQLTSSFKLDNNTDNDNCGSTEITHFVPVPAMDTNSNNVSSPITLPSHNLNVSETIDNRTYMLNLSLLALIAQIGEGAMSDWSTLFFHEVLHSSPTLCTTGFAVFSLSMAIGRFNTDYLLTYRYSPTVILRASGTLSFIGLFALVLSPSFLTSTQHFLPVIMSLLGLSVAGFGLSVIIPVVASSSAHVSNMHPSDSIATVTTAGYVGFLIGPPFFGFTADILGSLRWSLLIGSILVMSIAIVPWKLPVNRNISTHTPSTIPSQSILTPSTPPCDISTYTSSHTLGHQPQNQYHPVNAHSFYPASAVSLRPPSLPRLLSLRKGELDAFTALASSSSSSGHKYGSI